MQLVEFTRYQEGAPSERQISVNPEYVSWLIPTISDTHVIIRGPDGRGFDVAGSYDEVKRKLAHPGMVLVN
jgi:hypothetical protein